MKQGVLLQGRTRLLLSKGHTGYRERRTGERKRKVRIELPYTFLQTKIAQSVRGCIVGPDIGVLSAIIVKQGENDIAPLTTEVLPKRQYCDSYSHIRLTFIMRRSRTETSDSYSQILVSSPRLSGRASYTSHFGCFEID